MKKPLGLKLDEDLQPKPKKHLWRCKHRSCEKTSRTAGQCPIHRGSLVRSDRSDLLIA